MSMLKEMFDRIKTTIQKHSSSTSVIIATIAIIIFIISLGLNYVLNYLNGPTTNKNIHYNWEYIYSNSATVEDDAEWRIATYISPVSSEKTGNYLHLRTTLVPSDKDRNIIIKTDHAPIKVSLDKKDVYNNWYNKADYVANNYNSITIPASGSDTTVRISARVPFSPKLQISLNDNEARSYLITFMNVLSVAMLVISIIGVLLSVVLLFTKYRKSFNLILSLNLTAFSVFMVLSSFANTTYLLNSPQIYGVSICITYISLSLLLISIAKLFQVSLNPSIVFLIIGLLTSVANILVCTSIVYKAAIIIQYGMLFAASLFFVKKSKKLLNNRIKNANALNVILMYLCISFVASIAIQLLDKYRTTLGSFQSIYALFAFGFICFCYFSSLYFENGITKTEQKMQLYDECMQKIPSLVKNIAREDNINQVYKCIAESIYDICSTFLDHDENLEMSYCVAIKKSDGYDVVVNHKMPETVNFDIIESRYFESKKPCVVSQTYFYLIFKNTDEIQSIVYFEGVDGILSSFFVKAIETIYTVLDIILSNKNNSGITKDEQELFVNLAKDVEKATGSNETHVDGVAKYTRLILKEMGYLDSICDLVSNAAALHDIGKIAIPSEILSKYGLLSNKERSIMNKHTEYGKEILGSIDTEFMKIASEIAYEHHEHYDGSGNNKKSGEEINMYARIVAVADVFDALTTKRSYKEAWSIDDAVNAINQDSGKKFDPKVVEAFKNVIGSLKENISE